MQRNTAETYSDMLYLEVKTNTTIYQGHIVALENGKAVPASKKESLVIVGRAEETVKGGFINAKRGVFLYENDTDNPLNETHILKECYIKDSTTVTADSTTTSIAGKVIGFEDGQVKVEFK
ncbi:hypothetical protein [[Clostridium] colinum]|uniref:hypothetical protein n=1 Tax=[Clostridium] colinum TaxID=36835 RepID=UPI0020246698|nr:hypothetical protein [[Clostridium] colinum]